VAQVQQQERVHIHTLRSSLLCHAAITTSYTISFAAAAAAAAHECVICWCQVSHEANMG
jgi:hypothetical protein